MRSVSNDLFFLINKQNELQNFPTKYKQSVQKCFIHVKYGNTSAYARSLVQKKNILGLHLQNQQYFRKNAEFINANGRNFQVLRNLILRKGLNSH